MSNRTRTYLPMTAEDLRALAEAGRLPDQQREAYAATDALRAAEPAEDEEGLEFLAVQEAATAAAARDLLVVGSVDVDDDVVRAAQGALVRIDGELDARRIASFHLLDPPHERDVDADLELSWYDASELAAVRELVG